MYLLELAVITKYKNTCDKITASVGAFSHFKLYQELCKKGIPS